jgi:hypothetical protein
MILVKARRVSSSQAGGRRRRATGNNRGALPPRNGEGRVARSANRGGDAVYRNALGWERPFAPPGSLRESALPMLGRERRAQPM